VAEQGTNLPAGVSLTASLGLPPDRQQVAGFAMSGPAKLVYVWQIQYGIRVSAPGREAIPRIFTLTPPTPRNFWKPASAPVPSGLIRVIRS